MKNWTWKQWTAVAVSIAVIIALVTLHLIQPNISYAFAEIMSVISMVLGAGAMYLYKEK